MNIIKFKDDFLGPESGLTDNEITLFNDFLRGKYVHAINWTYCIPLDELDEKQAVQLSQLLCKLTGYSGN